MIARISACAVGSFSISTWLYPRPTTRPFFAITAPIGTSSLAAAFFEGDWHIRRGHNLKATVDFEDPDRDVSENQQARYSLLYEYTPISFLQLRGGFRYYRGIPQAPQQNQRLWLVELHGYF